LYLRKTCKIQYLKEIKERYRLTRNEQVSGSSPLVGSLFSLEFATTGTRILTLTLEAIK